MPDDNLEDLEKQKKELEERMRIAKEAKEKQEQLIAMKRMAVQQQAKRKRQVDLKQLKSIQAKVKGENAPLEYESDEDLAVPKKNIANSIIKWGIVAIVIAIAILMYSNTVFFFIQLGNQPITVTLIEFIAFMIIWNMVLTVLMMFGLRETIHNMKMFFGRRRGNGYVIHFDNDRGIKRYVARLNVGMLKINELPRHTDRKKIRLWNNKIPTYVYEGDQTEPSAIGIEDIKSPVNAKMYRIALDQAEHKGQLKNKKVTQWLLIMAIITLIAVFAIGAMVYQGQGKLDAQMNIIGNTLFEIANNTAPHTITTTLPPGVVPVA